MLRSIIVPFALILTLAATLAAASAPDSRSVRRWHSGWRYPQAGWIVLHIEGEPYERGLQHGHLLAREIAGYVQALAEYYGPQAPAEAWEQTRRLANVLFLRGFPLEQLEEMKGIADGASAEGARFNRRPIDVVDIVALNAGNEIDSLDDALKATPTGLEGLVLQLGRTSQPVRRRRPRPSRCSAFAAIGPATADGRIVFGHITMFDLYPANYYNVWLDLQPAKGYHFVMQTTPGGTHSGMDYSINQAGILMSETTLDQAHYGGAGLPLAARIRTAEQYAGSIEAAAETLMHNGNGLSTTEWILADIHRNEIALLTLGTRTSKLYRSSRKEWIDGAEGFYWSDNNIKDQEVRLETVPGLDGRPSPAAAYAPTKRDAVWLRLFDEQKGRIDAAFGRRLVTTPELVAAWAVDAKYTTTALASEFKTWATYGPPVGSVWRPTAKDQTTYSKVKPLIANPWTVLDAKPPCVAAAVEVADAPNLRRKPPEDHVQFNAPREPAWHGTLLPQSDADIWLTTAFANYERIVAFERDLRKEDDDEVAVQLAFYRSQYGYGVRAGGDFALTDTRSTYRDENWYRVVTGKGVLFLHTLRGILGDARFDGLMDLYGRRNAGKPVSSSGFREFLEKQSGRKLGAVFDWWLRGQGLPDLSIAGAQSKQNGARWITSLEFDGKRLSPLQSIPVTVETPQGEVTELALVSPAAARVAITTAHRPTRVVVDKYGLAARGNGSPYTILTLDTELERTLIVYGTTDEETGNREAARALQQALRRREHNVEAALKADRDTTGEELRTHHVILVGRPSTNALSARFAGRMPVHFGTQSFDVRDEVYTDPESAVISAADNPLNPRYSLVMVAGLSALGTLQIVPQFEDDVFAYAPVVILPRGGEENDLVPPLKELTRELGAR